MTLNPILFQLSADVSEREAYDLFKSGQIDAGQYSRILIECRGLKRQAKMQMALLVPQKRRGQGTCYSEGKF
jgi:hypothetical protein